MVKLISKTPCAGLLPLHVGDISLTEVGYSQITSVAAYAGKSKAVSTVLKAATGMAFPAPKRSTKAGAARCIWIAQDVAFVCGATVGVIADAAITDQSDGWAVVRLSGKQAVEVLARHVPVDLRGNVSKRDHTVRALLGHMNVSITRIDATTFEIMAMRSMVQTLVHELEQAMRGVTARG